MKRKVLGVAMLAALASCGAKIESNATANGGAAVETATLAKLSLTSDAFQDGGAIPAQFTCDGADRSPALSWREPPPETRSFALVVDDPDAPSGTFRHWGAFDLPANSRGIAAGQSGGTEVTNDMNKPGYAGPCPPQGNGVHHYHFKLFALDVDRLGVQPSAKVADVENEASKHAVAQGELIGTYERK